MAEQQEWESVYADHDDLKRARNEYLRENRNDEWRRLAKKGTLDEHLEFKANECAELARRLIDEGWFYREAWYHAKAAEIYNMPTVD